MSNSILYAAPAGITGDVSRPDESNREPVQIAASGGPQAFGVPVKYDGSGNALAYAGNELPSAFQGILARAVPAISGSSTNDDLPDVKQIQSILVRGYIYVICTQGTPVRGSAAYIRVVTNGSKHIGDIEATADITATAVAGTNTGNGTISAVTAVAPAQNGVYNVVFTAATKFNVFDPSGVEMLPGTTGVAYSDEGIGFTITAGGTAFVAGDTFVITAVQNNVVMTAGTWASNGKDANNIAELRVAR